MSTLRLSFVTVGARDLPTLRAFYGRWGWPERPDGSDEFVQYDAGGVQLALYLLALLGDEAAPGAPVPAPGWNGVTLALNVASRSTVDEAFRDAVQAGALVVAHPVARDWGGYSGYLADPEGTRWEVAWLPGLLPEP